MERVKLALDGFCIRFSEQDPCYRLLSSLYGAVSGIMLFLVAHIFAHSLLRLDYPQWITWTAPGSFAFCVGLSEFWKYRLNHHNLYLFWYFTPIIAVNWYAALIFWRFPMGTMPIAGIDYGFLISLGIGVSAGLCFLLGTGLKSLIFFLAMKLWRALKPVQ